MKTITVTFKLPTRVYHELRLVLSDREIEALAKDEGELALWDIFHALTGYFKRMKKVRRK